MAADVDADMDDDMTVVGDVDDDMDADVDDDMAVHADIDADVDADMTADADVDLLWMLTSSCHLIY
jgi:hypothetical protein